MSTESQARAATKYDKAHTQGLYLKLNRKTDEDIITALSAVENKQGLIKELLRKWLRERKE